MSRHATDDLNRRNVALMETTRQMVAMQQQLLQAQRLATVGQMASTFAHEIGSPLSALSVQAQLLLEDSNLTADQRETLGIIRKQIQTVVQIVNDLLRPRAEVRRTLFRPISMGPWRT
jgi:two-component system sensor histidine kinase AtoS